MTYACGHEPTRLTRNGLTVRHFIRRATGRTLRVEQVNDLIAIVEFHCTRLPPETACERCLDDAPTALAAAARQGGDVKQAPGEAPQSGPKGNAQKGSA